MNPDSRADPRTVRLLEPLPTHLAFCLDDPIEVGQRESNHRHDTQGEQIPGGDEETAGVENLFLSCAEGTHVVVVKLGHRHSPGYWLGKRVLAPALVRCHAAGFDQRGIEHVFLVGTLEGTGPVLAHTEPAVHQPLYEHGIVHVDK